MIGYVVVVNIITGFIITIIKAAVMKKEVRQLQNRLSTAARRFEAHATATEKAAKTLSEAAAQKSS